MIFKLTPFGIVLSLTTLINLFAMTVSWQRRKGTGGLYFALGMTAVTLWTLAAAFDYAAVPISLKVTFATLEYTFYPWALMFFAMFAIVYAGYDNWLNKRWVWWTFIALAGSLTLLAWTNDLTHWLWIDFTQNPFFDNVVSYEHGRGFIWGVIAGYFFIVVILVCFWQAMQRGSALTRRQARLLLIILSFTILSNFIYLVNIPHFAGVDFSSIAFSVAGLLMIAALYGTRFLDVIPIARNLIIDKMNDGILVLDGDRRLIDFNPVAQQIFGIGNTQLGQPILSLMAKSPQVTELISQPGKTRSQVKVTGEAGEQTFDANLTVLADPHGREFGQLLVFRNITELQQVEAALRFSEERYRTVADYTYNWEYWVSPDLKVQYMSPSCERVSGYRAEEFIDDLNLLERIILPEDRAIWKDHRPQLDNTNSQEAVHRATFRILRRDGSIRWIAHVCRDIYDANGVFLGVRSTHRDITSVRRAEEQLQQTAFQLIEEQQITAALEERQRLARDLHDSVSQSIHSLVLLAETLQAVLARGDVGRAAHISNTLQTSANQALKEVRLLLYQLQPSEEEASRFDLIHEIEFRLNSVERRAGIKAEFILEGDLETFPPERLQHIFRILIEALNNSLKHAQAHTVQVIMCATAQALTCEVSDDGIGFDPARPHLGGMGLQYMYQRANLIGGELKIVSAPDQGACVRLVISHSS